MTCAIGSNSAKHAWPFDHRTLILIILVHKGYFRIRKSLEAWQTFATKHAHNNSKPIPNQYSIRFKQ